MSDWRPHFEGRGNYRATCRLCGEDLDVRAGRPQKHLAVQHPEAACQNPPQPAPPVSHLPIKGAVALPGQAADPAPAEPARPSPPPTSGGSREELLSGLWADSRDKDLSATERARARELIAKVEGYAEEKEADTEELRLRHLERVRKAMDAQGGVEAETLRLLTDPINGRAAREWLRDLLTRAEGTAA